jgi:hypothetical protein
VSISTAIRFERPVFRDGSNPSMNADALPFYDLRPSSRRASSNKSSMLCAMRVAVHAIQRRWFRCGPRAKKSPSTSMSPP